VKLTTTAWGGDDRQRPCVLLLHGVTGRARSWWRVAPPLVAAGYRAIAADLPGHGSSRPLRRAVSMDEGIADLRETVAELADLPLDVVWGHSLGAGLALAILDQEPTFARRAILVDPPLTRSSPDQVDAMIAGWRMAHQLALHQPEVFRRSLKEEFPAWDEGELSDTVESMASIDLDLLEASFRDLDGFDPLASLATLRIPTLLLLAAEQRGSVVTGAVRQQLPSVLPPTVEMVEMDAGHNLHRDRFAEYMRITLDWLVGRSKGSSC
jgi:pimeloyl-ACP methyl ester carboxylesterase